jgi:Putative transposase/Transposase zinc-binding domain
LRVQHRKALAALAACRTAGMGGHIHRCNACGAETLLYNSCGDRHCPKCQAGDRAAWLAARQQELLPVEYFHVVLTVPHELAPVAAAHPVVFYNLLFRAVRETLLQVAATPRHLGARIGGLMVLHTWGQTLERHPHVHVIVPGGGLSPDGTRWISCKPGFFLPVPVLSRLLRGKLLAFLRQAYDHGELPWAEGLAPLADPQQFAKFLTPLYQKEWAVYAKPSFGGVEQSLKYLARYTYRVAISNDRIESLENGEVTFRYKDYAHGHRQRRMTLTAHEFLRRFLLHVLPRGFVRIRSFGFLANRVRDKQLALCRQLLCAPEPATAATPDEPESLSVPGDDSLRCPQCGQGVLKLISRTLRPRVSQLVARTYQPLLFDSS